MSEDSKKNKHKGKHEAKEQRKPRQQRQHAPEKKQDKREEPNKAEKKADQTNVAPPKPAFEEPGPEFYQNLKRETDDILKITEEANAKYKKKEIQSNWTKYEMPIESYEEMDQQENLGADYEKLIQAPMSAGGHFQFKHEKSWDINTAPSLYDKYFDINMDELANAISTIPFFERNNIEQSIFSQTDLLSMNHRAVKYKRKYYNDNSYGTTPDIEAHDKISKNIIDAFKSDAENQEVDVEKKASISESEDIVLEASTEPSAIANPVNKITDNLESKSNVHFESTTSESNETQEVKAISKDNYVRVNSKEIEEIDVILLGNTRTEINIVPERDEPQKIVIKAPVVPSATQSNVPAKPPIETKKPVIESPEDLEKWLDDFLDG